MGQRVLRIESLPSGALEAASLFHARDLPLAVAALESGSDVLAIVFPAAGYDHQGWRRAVVRDLARAHAPRRVNAVAGDDAAAIAATLAWLEQAPGVTGQLFEVDGQAGANESQSRS